MYRERGGGRHTRGISFALRYGMALLLAQKSCSFLLSFEAIFTDIDTLKTKEQIEQVLSMEQ